MGDNHDTFNNFRTKLNLEKYWDLTLTNDISGSKSYNGLSSGFSGITQFNFRDTGATFSDITKITSLSKWDGAKVEHNYSAGTISVSGTSVTGTNTTWTSDLVGGLLSSTATTATTTVASVASKTGLTINPAITADSATYNVILTGITLQDIGLTGIDVGLVHDFSGSTLMLPTGDTKMLLRKVSGATYGYSATSTSEGVMLVGGFYQGFFKLPGYKYNILPNRFIDGWTVETYIKKGASFSGYTGKTILNTKYPNNEGMLFYMGTRAENKFHKSFSGETGYTTTEDILLSATTVTQITEAPGNPFLNYATDIQGKWTFHEKNNYLYFSAATGTSINTAKTTKPFNVVSNDADTAFNAFGVRIKSNGSVGYRSLVITGACSATTVTKFNEWSRGKYVTGLTSEEQYTAAGVVENDKWTHLAVSYKPNGVITSTMINSKYGGYVYCGPPRKGTLSIYVNGVHIKDFTDVDEIMFDSLYEHRSKQLGVPYNISVGGGSQGLAESYTLNGPDTNDDDLNIEKYFAGSFIGYMSNFKLHNECMDVTKIRKSYDLTRSTYGLKAFNQYVTY